VISDFAKYSDIILAITHLGLVITLCLSLTDNNVMICKPSKHTGVILDS